MDVTRDELHLKLSSLWLNDRRVLVHASLRAIGALEERADGLLDVLLHTTRGVMMPAFTYATMVTPEVGPPDNGLTYGAHRDRNLMAQPFELQMPVDGMMGALAETLRRHPSARRTQHPILSFAGVRCEQQLKAQTLANPLAPIGALAEEDGWVMLIGVDQTVNTAIHYAERLAGRHQFVRWALTPGRVVECPGFPGDSRGFQAIAPELEDISRVANFGKARVQAMPLVGLLDVVVKRLERNPLSLLCNHADCERCRAVERAHEAAAPTPRAHSQITPSEE